MNGLFPRAVKVAVIRRATKDGVAYCECCGLATVNFRIDHIRARGLLGPPTLENAQLLGKCCYREKDARDTAVIALAKRQEAAFLGVKKTKRRRRRKREREAYQPGAGSPALMRRGFVPAGGKPQ